MSARGAGSMLAQFQGGGGGGGRVQMFCTTVNNFTGQVSVLGGETSNSQDGGTGSKLGPTCRPSVPTILKQYKLNLTTEIPVGGATAESSFYLAGNLSDPDSYDLLYLEVEVKAIGTAFTNTVTHSQTSGYPNPQACTGTGTSCGKINVTGLERSKEYHWQARVRDNKGGYSAWVSYGANDESVADIQLSGQAHSVSIIQGNNQSGVVNTQLVDRLGVRVVDVNNLPVAGFVVTWSVSNGANGGALIESLSTTTNSLGEAFNTYRLGKNVGLNSVRLTAQGLVNSPLSFSATGLPDVIHHFSIISPEVALVNTDFNITVSAYDQFNNLKTDYSGTVSLSPVSPLDINQTLAGILNPNSIIFSTEDNGRKEFAIRYDTVSSIKLKALEGLNVGISNTIAIIDQLGSCPDADGIIDTNQSWTANLTNNGIFDCRNVPNPRGTGIVDIINGAILTLTPYQDGDTNYTDDFGITILANSLQVDATSKINGDLIGYPATKGPGSNGATYDGASYGGYNGDNNKAPYGSIYEPYLLGSGGGNDTSRGGAGGSAIKLIIENELLINGLVSANGGPGLNVGSYGGGGGSGGSIWIDTTTINGSGIIRVNGGEGRTEYWDRSGAGAGGRIALYYSNGSFPLTNFNNIQARGGVNSGDGSLNAGPGTIYLEQKDVESAHQGKLMVDNNNVNGREAGLLEDSYEFNNILLTRYGHVKIIGQNSHLELSSGSDITGDSTRSKLGPSGTLTYTGGLLEIDGWTLNVQGKIEGVYNVNIGTSLQGGLILYGNTWAYNKDVHPIFGTVNVNGLGTITAYPYQDTDTDYTDEYAVTIEATTLNIANGGVVESNEKGYPATKGPGSNGAVYDGASHGGYNGDNNKAPYDSTYEPSMLGSGGGNSTSRAGAGGGALKFVIYSDLTNNGTITANGGAGINVDNYGGGGGSGGSIWIDTVGMNGNGVISANGGSGRTEYWDRGGSGGGGRIAIYYSNGTYPVLNTTNVKAYGGVNSGDAGLNAGAGTIYVEQRGVDQSYGGSLLIDNNNVNAKYAGVLSGNYTFSKIVLNRYGHLEFIGQDSVLNIFNVNTITGDSTKANLGTYGTFNYISTDPLNIDGFSLNVFGKLEGVLDVIIGTNQNASLTLYAHTWAYNNDNPPVFRDLTINEHGELIAYPYIIDNSLFNDDYGVTINADNIRISSGGLINLDGKGYPATKGPGSNGGAFDGASHGGYNGDESKGTYNSMYEPSMLGSGGGNDSGRGGAGGGALKLIVENELLNNGTISANGGPGINVGNSGGGGGSGGSIWIETNTINGNGLIRSNGGTGQTEYWDRSGGGSGGRIAVYYDSGNFPLSETTNVKAYGGINSGDSSLNAGPGTIFIKNINEVYGSLFIFNNNISAQAQNFEAIDYAFKDFKIGSNVISKIESNIANNRGVKFSVYGDFYLGPGAIIDGVGRGFVSDQGPGAGEAGQNLAGGGGGANGGAGGAGQSDGTFQAQGGQAYSTENQMQPYLLGSGGGRSGVGALGGNGGGAFALDGRYGHIDLYGTINVSGTNGLIGSPGGGGGAGGSVLLIANTCNITGNLIADGGDGGNDNFDGGGGGGGRISILVTSPIENCDASTAVVSVLEGFSSEGLIGQEGTYVGVSSLPQIQLDSQSKLTGELIPVGGVISDNQVRFTVELSDPGASLIDPKNLVADFEVVETSGSFTGGVLGLSSVTSDVVTVDSSDPSSITVSLTTGLTIGEDYMWRARVRNVDLGTVSEWSEFGDNGTYPDFSISSTQSFGVEVDKTEVEIGEAIAITVSALDGDSVVVPNYLGTVTFSYSPLSDPGPNLPSNYSFSGGDAGVHTFNNELMFFTPGDYQVIITDVNNPSITGTSVWITVLAPPATPTPTPTDTPLPTETPIPGVSETVTPTVTPYGDEVSPTPSTDNVLVSMTPTAIDEEVDKDCFEDPLQPKCQVNVVITNVRVTVDNEALTSEVCFDTNISTIGVIKYGTESYTDSSEVEKTYRVRNHCITLDNLASPMGYIFKIEAVSYAGKRGSYEGTFTTEGGVPPVIVEPKECIVINSTSFTDDHRAVLDYETSGPALCQVSYGSLGNDFSEILPKDNEELIKHRDYMDLIEIEPYTDLMYRILCEVKDGDKVNNCEAMDVISWNKIKTYYPEEGYRSWQSAELVGRIGEGLPFIGISFLGILLVANLFAFPQLPLYGLFILKRRKKGSPWGIVYDKEKKIPVSFAVLRLYDTAGKLIEQSVSSLDGKYGFIVDKANYRLEIAHSEYSSTMKDINIQNDGDILSENIPLTRKASVLVSLTSLKNNIASLNRYLIFIGLALSIIAFMIRPELLNAVILLLYLIQFVYLMRSNNRYFGSVFSESEIKGIQGAFVRLFDVNQGRQLEVAMTDKKGRYRLLADPGQYLLKVDLDGFRMADQNGLVNKFGENFIELRNDKGYITRNVVLKRSA